MDSASATDIPPLRAPQVMILIAFGLKSLKYFKIVTGMKTVINLEKSITGIINEEAYI